MKIFEDLLLNKKIEETIDSIKQNNSLLNHVMVDKFGRKYSLYHIAAMHNSEKLFNYLLDKKLQYNEKLDPWGPAHYCAFSNSKEVLNLIIKNNFKYNKKDERGKSPFYWSVLKKNYEVSEIFLENGVDVNVRFKEDQTLSLIHHESKDGRIDGLKFLLENGANPNTRDNRFAEESTPIHGACKFDRIKAVKLLLTHGADVNAKNSEGKTALDFVNESKKKLCKKIIQENGGKEGKIK